jgi:hypothetical protein
MTSSPSAMDSALKQVDESRSSCTGQCHEQIVGLYLIISPCGLNDHMVDLDELFWVARTIILVDGPRLELVRPGDLPE